MKNYYRNEDHLGDVFCELMNCSGEQPTESDSTGCTGCDACEEWLEEKYSKHIVDESDESIFLGQKDVKDMLQNNLNELTIGMDFPIYRKDIVPIFEKMIEEVLEKPGIELAKANIFRNKNIYDTQESSILDEKGTKDEDLESK